MYEFGSKPERHYRKNWQWCFGYSELRKTESLRQLSDRKFEWMGSGLAQEGNVNRYIERCYETTVCVSY